MGEPTLRRRLKHAIIRIRFPFKGSLARSYLRAFERYRSLRGRVGTQSGPDGLALPPRRLRVLVAGTTDSEWFLSTGRKQADYLRELLRSASRPIDQMDAVLDFGCGCGRIARWFSDLPRAQMNGCDYNRELVEWCSDNLGFMNVLANDLEPPLPFGDESFDLVYAYSVFTHLSVELAERWMTELQRLVKPGGFLWFTLHGESYRERLDPADLARFEAGDIVVWLPEIEGTNLCAAYWPGASVKRMLGEGFDVCAHLDPRTDPATAGAALLEHDAYLARRL